LRVGLTSWLAYAQQIAPAATVSPNHALLTVSAEGKALRVLDMAIFDAGVTTQGNMAAAACPQTRRRRTRLLPNFATP